jgi:long-chain fatty acid transport protein
MPRLPISRDDLARALASFTVRSLAPLSIVLGAGVALAPSLASASGFHVDEQDARATGRAGAVTASTNNASAVYYNPAGLADLTGVHLDVGGSLVLPSAEFTSAIDGGTTQADPQTFVLPQAFVSWRASELVSLGVGAYAPFGLALRWPASSPGRTNVREAELRTLFVSPVFALNLSRWVPGLSVGGGFDLVPASVRIQRDILFGSDAGSVALSGNAFGIGGRIGVTYRPPSVPELGFGISYRSPVELSFSGDVDFDAPLAYRAALPPDGAADTSVTLPQTLSIGVLVAPLPGLELELDGNWRGWSSYDKLEIELPDGSLDRQPKDWSDALTVRLGAEYTLEERWSLRVGGIWDQTPVPADRLDFQVPDANRVDLTLGVGARIAERFTIDLGALYVLPQKRSTSNEPLEPPVKGRFAIDVWVVGLSLGVELETAMAGPLTPEP